MKYLLILYLLFLPASSLAQDYTQLFNKLSDLSEEGNMEAAYHLGMLYNNGIGTPQNLERAYEWFKKSAEGNDPLGAYKLGCYYAGQAGNTVPIDKEKALKYKLISAKAGYSYAQFDVGLTLLQDNKIDEAIRFLKLAGRQGYRSAFFHLGGIYYKGEVVEKNLIKAHTYASLSHLMHVGATKALGMSIVELIENEMSESQIKISRNIIDTWSPVITPLTKIAEKGLFRSYEVSGLEVPASQ